MNIYDAIGVFFVIYFAATGVATHLLVLYHGQDRIKRRNESGRLREFEADRILHER